MKRGDGELKPTCALEGWRSHPKTAAGRLGLGVGEDGRVDGEAPARPPSCVLRLASCERNTNACRPPRRGRCEHPGESETVTPQAPQRAVFWLNNASQLGVFLFKEKGYTSFFFETKRLHFWF